MPSPPQSGYIHAATVGEAWLRCVSYVLERGDLQQDENVQLLEVLGLCVYITKPRWRDPIIDQIGDPAVISRTLAKFAKGASLPDRPFTYGSRIFDYHDIDQFEWMVDRLLTKRETKSATIGLLIPGSRDRHLPCLTTLDAKIRDGRLQLQFFFRSQNVFGRQYANLLAIARLQADLAARCGVEPGGLRGYVASAHIYDFDWPLAGKIAAGERIPIVDAYYEKGPRSTRAI